MRWRRTTSILACLTTVAVFSACFAESRLLESDDPLAKTEFHFADRPPSSPEALHPLYLELDHLDQDGGVVAAAKRIREVQTDPERIPICALWLRDQYMYGPAPDPLYGLLYFESLVALNSMERPDQQDELLEVLMMVYVSSRLLAIENVARCAEQPNGTQYRLQWSTEQGIGGHARRQWDRMTFGRQALALQFAKARVESAEGRPPNPTACAAGMGATRAAMDAGLCKRVSAAEVPNSDRYAGGSQAEFMRCDSARFATFVDDATWRERRALVREQYWDQLFGD